MLEASLMVQEKYADFNLLADDKIELLEQNGMKPSGDYAIILMNKAEALYSLGDKRQAIELAEASYDMLTSLPSAEPRAIAHAKANVLQFKSNRPSDQVMPIDMSSFFTKCENLKKGSTMGDVRQSFSSELEVGKDYLPKGVMKEIFATALPSGTNRKTVENFERTVFIPDANHTSDWCIVYEGNGEVKMTIVSAD